MQGGSGQAAFFDVRDLPADTAARDALLARVVLVPESQPGAVHSACGRVVLVGAAERNDCDVEYRYAERASHTRSITWRGDGGRFAAAVAVYAVRHGMLRQAGLLVDQGSTVVRIWLTDLSRQVVAQVQVRDGEVAEDSVFLEDGCPYPAAQVRLDYHDAAPALLPTGQVQQTLAVAGLGNLAVTLLWARVPMVFVRANDLGLSARESHEAAWRQIRRLDGLAAIRTEAAAAMTASLGARSAARVHHDIRVAWVAAPASYRTALGLDVPAANVDVLARSLVDGQLVSGLDHAGAIAMAAAAAVPGTVVAQTARTLPGVETRVGQACGVMTVDAHVLKRQGAWAVARASLSCSARVLMSGALHAPASLAHPG